MRVRAEAVFAFFYHACHSRILLRRICLASTHTALVSSPSLAVLHLSTYEILT